MYPPAIISHGVLYEMHHGFDVFTAFKRTYERYLSVTVGYASATSIAHERFKKLRDDNITDLEVMQMIEEYKLIFELSQNHRKEYLTIVGKPDFELSDLDERILYEIHINRI